MKRLEQIWRYINIHRSQSSKAKESSLPKSQTEATTEFRYIPVPYIVGPPLPLSDSRFVGRQEIALQIAHALENTKPPTFFLSGERRIGKTSFLIQLPALLSEQYLPVFCDLQGIRMRSNIPRFLEAITRNIYEAVIRKGFSVSRLTYDDLLEASKENELTAFYRFEQWLNRVMQTFDRNVRTILLTFDEYEILSWEDDSDFNLELLFSWFHRITQSNPYLVFLFCGVTPISDLDNRGRFHFNNIQALKIGSLHPSEARQLIIRPTSDFLGENFFGEDVVEEIIRVTGCYPFLIQGLCSILINRLNTNTQSRVRFDDIASASEEVFESWGYNYFANLWYRTSEEERLCLFVLNDQGIYDPLQLQQRTGLDEQIIHRALQRLLRRDLVVLENGNYRIVAPIFSKWVANKLP